MSLKRAVILGGGLIVAVLLGLYARQMVINDAVELLQPENATVVAAGQKVYAANCASCHGARLEGQPNWKSPSENGKMPAPPHDQSGHTWHHADRDLFDLTKFGLQKFAGPDYETDMPAFGGTLSDAEIWAVLSYIKSTWPPKIRSQHDRINKTASARR